MRRASTLLLALAAAGLGVARADGPNPVAETPQVAPQPQATPEYVIVVSEDGLRPDVIGSERTPNHVEFMKQGATARVARTIRESDTLPSHASMLSGFGAKEHGLHWNSYRRNLGFIHVPTVFSIAKKRGLSTAMFIGKPKLRHIAIPGSVDHLERPGYFCPAVSRRAAAYFIKSRPHLMFVHFSDPDDKGHALGWMSKEYLTAVANSDRCLGTLLAAVDQAGLADKTIIIVTADHGGHSRVHSGSHLEVDRQIPWMVRGPGVAKGSIIDADVDTVDTAATVLDVLGLPRPAKIAGTSRVD